MVGRGMMRAMDMFKYDGYLPSRYFETFQEMCWELLVDEGPTKD